MTKIFLFLVTLSLFAISCGDDESDCIASMLEGTYSGSSTCSNPQTEGPTALTVSANGNRLTIVDQDGSSFDVDLDGCTFEVPEQTVEFLGIEVKTSSKGEFLGSTLEFEVDIETDGEKENCVFSGTI